MSIFQFTDYREFLRTHFRAKEGGGRGQMQKLASALNVHSTFVSLVFKNKRDLSIEQAMLVTEYLNLTEAEADYFLNLVQYGRAGNHQLKKFLLSKITRAQENSKRLDTRFAHDRKLDAEERQTFYSSWHYSAIRVFTSTSKVGRTIEEICEHFKISRKMVVESLDFLTKAQLVIEAGGKFKVGPQRTYLEKGHPLLKSHHSNWRLKALSQFEEISADELMFTSTLSLSRADFHALREHIAQLIETTSKTMKDTEPEAVACLNIDFFFVK